MTRMMDAPRRNQVVQADALAWLRSLPDGCIDAFWFSPPYNLRDPLRPGSYRQYRRAYRYEPLPGEATSGAARQQGDGLLKPEEDYQAEQAAVLRECARVLHPDGVLFYNHKVRIKDGAAVHPLDWIPRPPLVLFQELVWDRGASQNVDPRRFLPVSERVYVLTRRAGVRRLDNPRRLHDVIRHPGNAAGVRAASGHPCPTPPAVVRHCLEVLPRPADGRRLLIADPYCGTGSTFLVASWLGMDWCGCDRIARYVTQAARRVAEDSPLFSWPMQDAGPGAGKEAAGA